MTFDEEMILDFYKKLPKKITAIQTLLKRPLTLVEKILYAHTFSPLKNLVKRGGTYLGFRPDRVAMQDATAQMALLQFIQSGKSKVSVPSTVHCDHLIQASVGAKKDLDNASVHNKEVYDFLASVSNKYGIGFWKPGAGIIHQVVLENYAFPGGLMVGTDSHTPNAGGLGMIAIGVGGADAVDVMVGMPWELKVPRLIGVHLTGQLSGWVSAKDVILKIAGMLTVKGGTDCIVEYFGPGAESISATGKGTICNMGAEIGATTSLFAYDEKIASYLKATARDVIASSATGVKDCLRSDPEVYANPEAYYDQVVRLDLSQLEPHINGPFTPDLAWPVSKFAKAVKDNNWPEKLEVGLIGSCTNSSYEDLTRAASIARQANEKHLKMRSEFTVTPGSELVRFTAERDGVLNEFESMEAVVLANACGPCIGQWTRHTQDPNKRNSIMTSFNRNFAKRNDGNVNTHAFVASPEVVTAFALSGSLLFNPVKDKLKNKEGEWVSLDPPEGLELPLKGFSVEDMGYIEPMKDGSKVSVVVSESSDRLQLLDPFKAPELSGFQNLSLLLKAKGKCTTDHISMAGPWLKFRGHLDNISNNMFIGAVNAFNNKTNAVRYQFSEDILEVPQAARKYKKAGVGTVVIGDENYGEGSSREHAAMEPRHLGVKAIIVKSFARIHETNLKKQGVLALTFANKSDYENIQETDTISIVGLESFSEKSLLTVNIQHKNGDVEQISVNHTYSKTQIDWFHAGAALNVIRLQS